MAHSLETWDKIKREYETIGTSYAKLAKKFGVGVVTIKERAKKESWVKLLVEKAVQAEAQSLVKIVGLHEKIERAEEYIDEHKDKLENVIAHEDLKAQIALHNDINKLAIVNKSKVAVQQINEYEDEALDSLKTASQITKSIDPPVVHNQTHNTLNVYENMDLQELQRELADLRARVGT